MFNLKLMMNRNQQKTFLLRNLLFAFVTLTLTRLSFFFMYSKGDSSFSEVLLAFVNGVRFDMATIGIFFLIPSLFYLVTIKSKLYYRFWRFVFAALTLWLIVMVSSDTVYFSFTERRASIELLLFFENIVEITVMLFTQYWYYMLLLMLVLFLVYKLYYILVIKPSLKVENFIKPLLSVLIIPVVMIISVIVIRGGLQTRPLTTAMAFQNENAFLGNLALNGAYTSLTALYKKDTIPTRFKYTAEKADAIRRLLYKNPDNSIFVDKEYPFYRKHIPPRKQQNYNVVVFILESWSAADLKIFGSGVDATPFFDKLAADGYMFKNHFATGQRSISSLPSIISSIPSVFDRVYTTSSYAHNKQTGLGTVFKQKGYRTYFAYAARDGSMGFSAYARIAGFDTVVTRESFDLSEVKEDGSWGVFDHYTLNKMHGEFQSLNQPFLAVIYTLHPHPPFVLPEDFKKPFSNIERSDFFNALNYTDKALAGFFEKAQRSEYHKKTLYVFTADHSFSKNPGKDKNHIPLLFYAPGLVEPGEDYEPASQLDILPSIIDILNINTAHNSMGVSLFDENARRFALIDRGNLMGFIAGDYALLASQDKAVELYNYIDDPGFSKNLIEIEQAVGQKLEQNFYDYLAAISYSVMNNKIKK